MRYAFVQRIMGLLLTILSGTMLPPIGIALYYGDGGLAPFMDAGIALFILGLMLWLPVRNAHRELRLRDGFLIVSLFWLVLSFAGAAPLLLADRPDLSITDAVFEAVSGLTTTGSTVLAGLESLPHSILWYRAQLHWLGGMGIIVLAVAILPMLGVGGMQMYRAETAGPVKDSKITPRITQTAKALWFIYFGLTMLCALAYWLAGMSVFDAITHSFSTLATGGFSTHDASLAYFHSSMIEWLAVLFMCLGGINFSLHFLAWRNASLKSYWQDPECRTYLLVLLTAITIITFYLLACGIFGSFNDSLRASALAVVSVVTTTGFITEDFSLWPTFVPLFIIFIGFMGGCAGSTSGGMKVIRLHLLFKQGVRELQRLIHPSAQVPLKMGERAVPDRVMESVWGFVAIYVLLVAVMTLMLIATGLTPLEAFSAVAASINNVGPGLGSVFYTFADVSDVGKWTCTAAMLLGRLEIFTLLVLFTPSFWRH